MKIERRNQKNPELCVRCRKTVISIGRQTDYGPVCNACSPYFREPKPCTMCGALSSRLSRAPRLGILDLVCPKCAKADYGTCHACHRFRKLFTSADGIKLCLKCSTQDNIPCSKCFHLMPPGRGHICEECYWQDNFSKKLRINLFAFKEDIVANEYKDFCFWLTQRIGFNKAALTIKRYLQFYVEIETRWNKIPNYQELIVHFGSSNLRKVLLPYTWLIETKKIIPIKGLRELDTDQKCISKVLKRFVSCTFKQSLVEEYYNYLLKRYDTGKLSLRSLRLAITPVANLIQKLKNSLDPVLFQKVICEYLAETPGQRTAIIGYVQYLKKELNILVSIPPPNLSKQKIMKHQTLEMKLIHSLLNQNASLITKRERLSLALSYFHNLPRSVGLNIKEKDIIEESTGIIVVWNDQKYWIPMINNLFC